MAPLRYWRDSAADRIGYATGLCCIPHAQWKHYGAVRPGYIHRTAEQQLYLCDQHTYGPPNVIARIICFTEAGSNGVAGGYFYYIPNPVQFTANGQVFLSSSCVINDNVTTSAAFTFTDQVLLASTEIDVQGNNLFNQIELGSAAWDVSYAGRLMFGGCQAKIQNFTNLSFDGGYLNSSGVSNLLPLGWNIPAAYNPAVGAYFSITGYSITSSVVTFSAVNTLQVGQQVYVQGLTVVTALNNLIYTVISSIGTQFTAATSNGNVTFTLDNGQAIPINSGVTLNNSAIFGNSLFISNTTGATRLLWGCLRRAPIRTHTKSLLSDRTRSTVYASQPAVRSAQQVVWWWILPPGQHKAHRPAHQPSSARRTGLQLGLSVPWVRHSLPKASLC